MKKSVLLLLSIIIIVTMGCQGRYVDGREFFSSPFAYKGKIIMLKLLAQKSPRTPSILYSPEWKPLIPIRFDNALAFKIDDPSKIYLVTFRCNYGSIYHGNEIIKVFSYP
jgi:hypothetical protein